MSDLVERAKAALEDVTEGPWTWKGDSFDDQPPHCPHGTDWTDHGPDLGMGDQPVITSYGYDASGLSIKTADAEFIAAARTLIPELIAELIKTRFELEWAQHDRDVNKDAVNLLRAELGIR